MIWRSGSWLTNDGYDLAIQRARKSGVNLNLCPVCGQRDTEQGPEGGVPSEPHNCTAERKLHRRFYAAGIGPRFIAMDWHASKDKLAPKLCQVAQDWLSEIDEKVAHGESLVLLSPGYGSGKTSAAMQILMDGIVTGHSALKVSFDDLIGAYQREDAYAFEQDMVTVDLLLVDEIKAPSSKAQGALFDTKLHRVINERYEYDKSVLITGNIDADEVEMHYPSVWSRLSEASEIVTVEGQDLRPHFGQLRRERRAVGKDRYRPRAKDADLEPSGEERAQRFERMRERASKNSMAVVTNDQERSLR